MFDQAPLTPIPGGHFLRNGRARELCLYPGRVCYLLRDRKRNGYLYRLCRMHRQRHNQHQWESLSRRRRRQQRRTVVETPRMEAQADWRDALGHFGTSTEILPDDELFAVLFVEPGDTLVPDFFVQYQQLDVDPLPDGPENT